MGYNNINVYLSSITFSLFEHYSTVYHTISTKLTQYSTHFYMLQREQHNFALQIPH